MTRFIKKALADIRSNRFLNFITIITISLSILVVSVFTLFFENASRVIQEWNQGGRAMVYLQPDFSPGALPLLEADIRALGGIEEMTFISRDEALEKLKKEMSDRSGFFDTLKDNPLPHALEIRMQRLDSYEKVSALAGRIQALAQVESVEYGQDWLGRFLNIFHLFKTTGYAMCSLFLLIALFITANTVRLAFHSRELEVEIMRLVGATESFIKTPFYVEGAIQGFLGGVFGLGILLAAYLSILSGMARNPEVQTLIELHFLSVEAIIILISSSTFLGWFGCYISLKQILK